MNVLNARTGYNLKNSFGKNELYCVKNIADMIETAHIGDFFSSLAKSLFLNKEEGTLNNLISIILDDELTVEVPNELGIAFFRIMYCLVTRLNGSYVFDEISFPFRDKFYSQILKTNNRLI